MAQADDQGLCNSALGQAVAKLLFFGKGSGADSELLLIGVRVVVLVKRRGVGRKVSWSGRRRSDGGGDK